MQLAEFEAHLKSNVVNLAELKQGEPIKTREQRREEWLLQRRGKFTASDFHKLMTNGKKEDELSVGAKTYCLEKAVETLADIDESDKYISVPMQWGMDHEFEAIEAFAEATGHIVHATGEHQRFIESNDGTIGCTPDGLIAEHIGIEVKCPSSKQHFVYSGIFTADDLKQEASEYYWQIMGSLLVTNRNYWYFISYDPRFKSPEHRLNYFIIERNELDIARLALKLKQAIEYKDALLERFFEINKNVHV